MNMIYNVNFTTTAIAAIPPSMVYVDPRCWYERPFGETCRMGRVLGKQRHGIVKSLYCTSTMICLEVEHSTLKLNR